MSESREGWPWAWTGLGLGLGALGVAGVAWLRRDTHGPPIASQMHHGGVVTPAQPTGIEPGPKGAGYNPSDGTVPGADDWTQIPTTGPGYEVRRPKHAWGTKAAVASLLGGLERYDQLRTERGMNVPDIRIGDMSRKGGGPFPPHKSHHRGRDVDMSWRGKLPIPQTAVLLLGLMQDDNVGAVYLDHGTQGQIWDALQADPTLAPGLANELQYPLAAHSGRTRIRHWPGHSNHLHVRFRE